MPEDPATIELNELGQRAGGSSPPIMVGGNAKRNKNCKLQTEIKQIHRIFEG